MTEPEPPAPRPASHLTSPPQQPAIADALRALGPDYEEALVNSIAERVDELARRREARAPSAAPPAQSHPLHFSGAPAPLPVPAPPPAPPVPAQVPPHETPPHEGPPRPGGPGMAVSILSLIFGFVATIVALTAGLAISGPVALIAILIVWAAIVLINVSVWQGSRS